LVLREWRARQATADAPTGHQPCRWCICDVPGGALDQSCCPGPRARREAAAPNLEHAKATVLEKELAEAVAPNQARERGGRRPGPRARRGRRPGPRARRGRRLRPTARCDTTHDQD
jgi:hypothetical protein